MNGPTPVLTEISAIKLALMAKQVRTQAEQVLRADPIAIVGLACRVPGADTPSQFWQMLRDGVCAVRDIPADRWDASAWYDPDPAAVAKSATKRGGFLDRIDEFDAAYFGILPREAECMDPQQRLLLEVAIEAIDDAGLPHERLRGSRTGVYIASYHNDYAQLQNNDPEAIDSRTLTGTLHSVLANRLSYFLDLRGPSMAIDTACSSSLVAIHMACQSLRFGETDVAIAGGVSLMITPELMVSMSKLGFMAPNGCCKTFDEQADGFGRGEGCGIVVLKRLSDAIAGSDRIIAVIRGSAVNQDGHSALLAAPNGPAQEALIREALVCAQVTSERIGFVEAHGTGTALGDPIEIEALAATIGRPSPGRSACLLGSAKANLGHLEAAAGVTGLIKAVLALRHEAVPPQVNFSKLNPHISLAGTRFSVPKSLVPWAAGSVPRCAAVSSFGIGGTNANVILEEAPTLAAAETGKGSNACHFLPLSAHTSAALQALARSWVRFLDETPATVVDLCHTASLRRTHYGHRIAVAGRSKEELSGRLEDLLGEQLARSIEPARPANAAAPRVGFVFGGQGPQWHAMGRELLKEEPVFCEKLSECDALLRPLSGWSLLDELARPEEDSRLNQTEVAQPALFALQVALAALLKAWGVPCDAVVGHSLGEIAALHVAGVLDLHEAICLVWHRGRIMQQATGLGRMASVAITEAEAMDLERSYGGRLAVGAINAPRSIVLSGEAEALEEALAKLTARGVSHRMLPVQYAFHSAQMAPFRDELVDQLGEVRGAAPATAIYSTVTGGRAKDLCFDAAYFGRNVRDPVRFASAIRAMVKDGYEVFVEIGPQPVLSGSIAECLTATEGVPGILATLRRGRPEREALLQTAAGVYAAGCNLNWAQLQSAPGRVVELPAYPWQRKRHWIRVAPAKSAVLPAMEHSLLGHQIPAAGIEAEICASLAIAGKTDDLLYDVAWQRAPELTVRGSPKAEGMWLLFADHGGTAEALAAEIEAAGGGCCRVAAGDAFERTSEQSWTVNPAEPEHFIWLLEQGGWRGAKSLRGVIHCWSLDLAAIGEDSTKPIVTPDLLGPAAVLHLVQSLAATPALGADSLWLVTRGAQTVSGVEPVEDLQPRTAGLWGLAGVVAMEHPELNVRVIDLDTSDSPAAPARLLRELLESANSRVALRGALRWVPRLRRYARAGLDPRADRDRQLLGFELDGAGPAPSAQLRAAPAAAYWITGGLGALGLETARWLVRRGARHLVLSGRQPPGPAAKACIRELEEFGARVLVFQADAADRDRMRFVLDEIRRSPPPLRGIVHAAGATHDAVLMNQRWPEGGEPLRGKAEGAFVLHELTRDIPLDFFILYSAAGVVLGAAGQGMYPAANAELDALADVRRRLGLPALSVAWGPWAGAGMAANLPARGQDVWQARGLGKIEAATGFAQLERLLADGASYGAVIPIDWTHFLARLPAGADRDFFSTVAPVPAPVSKAGRSSQDGSILERLRALPSGQRRQGLLAHLTQRALHVLGLEPATPIDLRVPLKEIGLDSLMAVELRNSLARLAGQTLPATLLFDYPSLDALAAYLSRAWQLEADAASAATMTSPEFEDPIVHLSDAEAEALLLEELQLSPVGRSA